MLGPGDAVLFSGGNAHMALSVSAGLSITAYESFVNLHPRNLSAFLDSGTPQGKNRKFQDALWCNFSPRLLEKMAYFALYMVERLSLHPIRRFTKWN